jgi:hypothetical protein
VKTSWEILTRKNEKRTRKDNSKIDVRLVARMRVERTGGIRSIAVLESGRHFSMSELHFPRSRCSETMSQTFTDSEDNLCKGSAPVQFTLEQASNSQSGSRYIVLLVL